MFWINIDKPTKTIKIHHTECKYIVKKETKYKGLERELRDGGWFLIDSSEAAQQFFYYSYPDFDRRQCNACNHR
ncbi:hypothetical protein CV093_15995 [Oceanobacillus sp. 143]|uniref:Uncharacterized protein n=1 Tax=Oceanobacillus zhaokaii TaxID=2052660 RepID=A0A345PJI8_9BACI|nr:hypothetical protein [Oceanobacillus zhaokaii]AXI10168.1 hypothetical protein CUC15_15050 [Oceanobacillus zhaokaii]QGS69276.1 hypothetical protein CV093_15995 [Oceanobacillus sp. 143]